MQIRMQNAEALTQEQIQAFLQGSQAIEFSEILVAFSAAVFWPVDLIAMALLAAR